MMSGEEANAQALDEPGAEKRGRDRWKQRLLAALPFINTAAVLVLISICGDALVTAWQTSDWQHFYWNTSGPISLLFALSQYPRLWPDTPTKVVAPGANRKAGSTSEPLPDYAVSPAWPSPLERLTETPASIIRLAYSMWSRPDVWKQWKRTMLYGPVIVVLMLWASAWGLRWVQHGGNWGLEQIQLAFDGGLPDRIHAETPLFSDALAADDGQWPVHPATAHDAAYGYADGEYEISAGSGRALLNQTYGDVAVEVTARLELNGPLTWQNLDNLGQAGLVLRAGSDPNSLITFTFGGGLGDWSLRRYRGSGPGMGHWQVLEHGERPGLRTSGDPDRLLVLMRGSEYICFVNDKPVAHVYDDAPVAGQVGLWLRQKTVNDKLTVGYFSHFTVYPAV